ncbi:putative ATP-dependent RNA helicase DDX20 [Papilio machaon]|uniref:RNA helicase n=1 Tax=Papilio machaon TaxID=76193 RepID=A0A194QPD7_PAPMA|nr:putative ATP-dependent RNA helicase DDX20 [Papilio machaon]
MVLAHDINEGHRTQDVRISQDITFDTMLLNTRTLQGLNDSGFHRPSPIQLHGIPLGKCGFDLLLEAKSGTGKTAVFSVIALEKIDINKGLQVVILAPTREIAMQIHDVIKQIGVRYEGLCVEVVMGGLPVLDDVEKFKKNVHIVVGSPGRLKHLIQDKYIVTTSVRLLILDEADKLMEKSFEADINYIHSVLPQQKQVIMSSATFPESSKNFIENYVQNAQHICPESTNVLLGIEQRVTLVKYSSNIVKQTQYKFVELLKILSNRQFKQCLIFCNYQARVGELHKMLNKEKWPAGQLYGQQQQTERLDALKILQEYKCRLLIATDLAARGIDASNVDLVINFESPCNWETYLHRIGRAGRFGSYGLAITILSEGVEHNNFKSLIESLKLPFLLKDFWSNTPFCINIVPEQCDTPDTDNLDLDSKIVSKASKEVNYTKLWDVLTDDGKKAVVESFGNLCESFTEPDNKIDLFNDLMQSFKENEANNVSENVNFSQLNLLKLPDKSHCLQKLHQKTSTTSLINKNDEVKEFRTHNGNSQTGINCSKIILNHKDNHYENPDKEYSYLRDNVNGSLKNGKNSSTNSSKANSPVTNHNSHDLNRNATNCYDEANVNNDEIEVENVSKALDDFKLRPSFSSSKQTQSQKHLTQSYNANEVDNKWDESIRDRRNNKAKFSSSIKTTEKSKSIHHQEKKNKGTVLRDSMASEEEENYITQLYLTKSRQGYSHHRYKMHDEEMQVPSTSKSKNKSKQTYQSQNIYKNQNTKEYDSKKYIKWYSSLKLHVRQIEQIIYLNEISKL